MISGRCFFPGKKEAQKMTRNVAVLRFVFFCLFFAIGSGAMTLAILAGEINDYYRSKDLLAVTQRQIENIKNLTAQYDAQLRQIEKNPNTLSRLRQVTLGEKPHAEDTVFPRASELDAAAAALFEDRQTPQLSPAVPRWPQRISHTKTRKALFLAGAILILLAFVFFGTQKPASVLKSDTDRSAGKQINC